MSEPETDNRGPGNGKRRDGGLSQLPPERREAVRNFAEHHTLAKTLELLADDHIKTSRTALSDWLAVCRVEDVMRRAGTAVEKILSHLDAAGNGWMPQQAQTAGQAMFTAMAIEGRDIKAWRATQALALKREQLELDQAKFKETLRGKLQLGLDALAEAFQGNPRAMELYQEARELIAKETT
jgi:hypothetical protein